MNAHGRIAAGADQGHPPRAPIVPHSKPATATGRPAGIAGLYEVPGEGLPRTRGLFMAGRIRPGGLCKARGVASVPASLTGTGDVFNGAHGKGNLEFELGPGGACLGKRSAN